MWFFKSLLLFCALVLAIEAKERHECEIKHNVTDADWEQMKKGISHLPDNLACFMKCALEKDGVLDNAGKINFDKFNSYIDNWVKLTEKEKTNANNCLKTIAPIKSCSDIQPLYLCLVNSDK
ncbi:hypothetical protein WA026_010872 [Henosepilachna vigintioctopunctata]|uniref:Uncharacterized protein n=1 Tax=Henosepilachna vigintioctopunctata TaxID=420089 RepID=A0AAW1UW84_9CUCU